MYSLGVSEEVVGRALKDFAQRDEVVIATKVFYPLSDDPNDRGLSRKHILAAIDNSLRRLGTDYVDLYQIHRWDPQTPIEETLEALDTVVRAGKARYIGASSMMAWQFAKALYTSDRLGLARFVTMQNHYNLVYREEEREMIPLCIEEGIGLIPWSPLARGFLAGNRRSRTEGETAARDDRHLRARSLLHAPPISRWPTAWATCARECGLAPMKVALAWMLRKPCITAPIIGATKMSHLDDAVAAIDVKLSDEQIARLEEPYAPHPVLMSTPPLLISLMTRHLLVVVAFILASASSAVAQPKGALVIVGGGGTTDKIVARTLELAGGKNAVVVVLPQSSAVADAGDSSVKMWLDAGAKEAKKVAFTDPDAKAWLEHATLIWMPGGDQNRFMKAIDGTGLDDVIRSCYQKGAVVGGTSAGAAVLSEKMITGDAELTSLASGKTASPRALGSGRVALSTSTFSAAAKQPSAERRARQPWIGWRRHRRSDGGDPARLQARGRRPQRGGHLRRTEGQGDEGRRW